MHYYMRTDKQDKFVGGVKRRLAQGLDLGTASRRTAKEVYGSAYRGSVLLKTPRIRKALGLDDPGFQESASTLLLEGLKNAKAGIFPDWVGEDSTARARFYRAHVVGLRAAVNCDGEGAGLPPAGQAHAAIPGEPNLPEKELRERP